MAASRSGRRSARKRRGGKPRAVASDRRQRRESGRQQAGGSARAGDRLLGTVGSRPGGPFGGIPVSEVAILAGMVALITGTLDGGGAAVDVGILLLGLGVFEVTAREHLSGYRSHTTLLALLPAVIVEALYALVIGAPRQRILLLAPVLPIFGFCYWLLRRQFRVARHQRVIKHH